MYKCLNVYLCTKFVQCVDPWDPLDPMGLELDIVMSHHVGCGSRTRSSGRPIGDLNCWATSPAHVYLIRKAVKDLQLCFIMTKDYFWLSVTLVRFPRGVFRQEPETYITRFHCQIFTFKWENCPYGNNAASKYKIITSQISGACRHPKGHPKLYILCTVALTFLIFQLSVR